MEKREVIKRFIELYGGTEEGIRVFMSPGRVNLIGEHTDYNGGYVFPAALTLRSLCVVRLTGDRKIKLAATDLDGIVTADIDRIDDYKDLKWGNYQLGVASELIKDGYEIQGCEMLYDDTVPIGSGLSSSAAIQIVTAVALSTLADEAKGIKREPDMVYLAKIGQRSEHNYVGVMCGIMDQFASANGKANHAILLNCKNLEYKLVPVALDGYKIVILNTNKKRSLATSKYNERCAECAEALNELKEVIDGIDCLGDVTLEQFNAHKDAIKNDVVRKRAEHVVSEDDRVLKSVTALENGDIKEFGRLMIGSHNSLRDLYEVTGIELDTLVSEALKVEGCIGARMTGAGFGGCAVSIVKETAVDEFIEKVGRAYEEKIGYPASFYVSDLGDGGHEVK